MPHFFEHTSTSGKCPVSNIATSIFGSCHGRSQKLVLVDWSSQPNAIPRLVRVCRYISAMAVGNATQSSLSELPLVISEVTALFYACFLPRRESEHMRTKPL